LETSAKAFKCTEAAQNEEQNNISAQLVFKSSANVMIGNQSSATLASNVDCSEAAEKHTQNQSIGCSEQHFQAMMSQQPSCSSEMMTSEGKKSSEVNGTCL
jgi:hypothetical protein